MATQHARAEDALERLREGNLRYASDLRSPEAMTSHSRRSELAKAQEPCAIVMGCSDSRVPAEIVFDQGLGELFVIRVMSIVDRIRPAIEPLMHTELAHDPRALKREAVRANVLQSANHLLHGSPILENSSAAESSW